jgi:hypothetical protein
MILAGAYRRASYPCPAYNGPDKVGFGKDSSFSRVHPFLECGNRREFCSPQKLMHKNSFWVLHPGVARHGFSLAITAWVESPWDISYLFLVPRVQHRSFGRVNNRVEYIRQFKEVPWGMKHSPLVHFALSYLSPFQCYVKYDSENGVEETVTMRAPQWVRNKSNTCVGYEMYIDPREHSHIFLFYKCGYRVATIVTIIV